jgi:tripartite-type tricarboxylate transporter receptor subunit TctC
MPDVPTVAQTGLGQVNVAMWFGVFAPAGLPAEQVASFNREINQILSSEEVKTAFSTQGMDPATATPAEFARLVERDAQKWARLVKSQGITAD